jgi:hypothetical protein
MATMHETGAGVRCRLALTTMRAIAHRPVPPSVLEWHGDYRWWARPDAFRDPFCLKVVPDLDAALRELQRLYDDGWCRHLVDAGFGRMVVGLFGGFTYRVDMLLQLGADLTLCEGWATRPKLVGDLRSPDGFDGARFEVGVWAGLRRVGLAPRVEEVADKSMRRADFVVSDAGLDVAIELKTLAEPAFERNRLLVANVLGNLFVPIMHDGLVGDVTLKVSDKARAMLHDHERFYDHHLSRFESELVAALPRIRPGTTTQLPTIGTVTNEPCPDGEPPGSVVGGYLVDPGEEADPAQNVMRALLRVKQRSQKQLTATSADLRVAVIYGSKDELPALWSADLARVLVERDKATWERIAVDWIVFLNGHRRGPTGRWTTEVEVCRLPNAQREIPAQVIRGLTQWGEMWRG